MPTVRKIRMHRIRLASGRELLLDEREAKEIGDALIERALVGAANQRRLAFGDIALEQVGTRMRPLHAEPAGTLRRKT